MIEPEMEKVTNDKNDDIIVPENNEERNDRKALPRRKSMRVAEAAIEDASVITNDTEPSSASSNCKSESSEPRGRSKRQDDRHDDNTKRSASPTRHRGRRRSSTNLGDGQGRRSSKSKLESPGRSKSKTGRTSRSKLHGSHHGTGKPCRGEKGTLERHKKKKEGKRARGESHGTKKRGKGEESCPVITFVRSPKPGKEKARPSVERSSSQKMESKKRNRARKPRKDADSCPVITFVRSPIPCKGKAVPAPVHVAKSEQEKSTRKSRTSSTEGSGTLSTEKSMRKTRSKGVTKEISRSNSDGMLDLLSGSPDQVHSRERKRIPRRSNSNGKVLPGKPTKTIPRRSKSNGSPVTATAPTKGIPRRSKSNGNSRSQLCKTVPPRSKSNGCSHRHKQACTFPTITFKRNTGSSADAPKPRPRRPSKSVFALPGSEGNEAVKRVDSNNQEHERSMRQGKRSSLLRSCSKETVKKVDSNGGENEKSTRQGRRLSLVKVQSRERVQPVDSIGSGQEKSTRQGRRSSLMKVQSKERVQQVDSSGSEQQKSARQGRRSSLMKVHSKERVQQVGGNGSESSKSMRQGRRSSLMKSWSQETVEQVEQVDSKERENARSGRQGRRSSLAMIRGDSSAEPQDEPRRGAPALRRSISADSFQIAATRKSSVADKGNATASLRLRRSLSTERLFKSARGLDMGQEPEGARPRFRRSQSMESIAAPNQAPPAGATQRRRSSLAVSDESAMGSLQTSSDHVAKRAMRRAASGLRMTRSRSGLAISSDHNVRDNLQANRSLHRSSSALQATNTDTLKASSAHGRRLSALAMLRQGNEVAAQTVERAAAQERPTLTRPNVSQRRLSSGVLDSAAIRRSLKVDEALKQADLAQKRAESSESSQKWSSLLVDFPSKRQETNQKAALESNFQLVLPMADGGQGKPKKKKEPTKQKSMRRFSSSHAFLDLDDNSTINAEVAIKSSSYHEPAAAVKHKKDFNESFVLTPDDPLTISGGSSRKVGHQSMTLTGGRHRNGSNGIMHKSLSGFLSNNPSSHGGGAQAGHHSDLGSNWPGWENHNSVGSSGIWDDGGGFSDDEFAS